MSNIADIIVTKVDEAPQIASSSLLPVIQAFAHKANITIGLKDISLSSRIIAQFSNQLTEDQQQTDDLAWLGEWVHSPDANIIKLPNISASVAQIKAAVTELQQKGFNIPNYPDHPKTEEEKNIKATFNKVKGSAVNPVLRQGNSDRRSAQAIKNYAKKHPHHMGDWSADSKTNVAHMTRGDFYGNEVSTTIDAQHVGSAHIEFIDSKGDIQILKNGIELGLGDVIDATHMDRDALQTCIHKAMNQAKKENVLLSLHLKATMMKVSDPIIFGEVVKVYFADVFEQYADTFSELGINPDNGMSDVYSKITALPKDEQQSIKSAITACLSKGPELAMVDSDKGITNLRVPSDVIVDASMASLIRNGGKMWGPDGEEHDTLAIIPDRSYAGIYQATIDFCRSHGAFDPTTMGSVANVGLMAQKAEEYGSHDKTFLAPDKGEFRVVAASGDCLLKQEVNPGDIFRSCVVKAAPIQDWVALAIDRCRLSNTPVIFWLDESRAHDAQIINKVTRYLKELDTTGLNIQILSPNDAMNHTLTLAKQGDDCIAATGNVLRDYLTDLFPILELGTSAKMLSIVPLASGGGLFETGAGGSAPRHVQQFIKEGHLRWDSLGEFLALAESLAHLARQKGNAKAQVLSNTLNIATSRLLDENHSPSRQLGGLSNNDSHLYETLYWADALAEQNDDKELKAIFTPLAKELTDHLDDILKELKQPRGAEVNCGGYYRTDNDRVNKITRASQTFNQILTQLS